jgi:predicted N-acetyltransferase YhbS
MQKIYPYNFEEETLRTLVNPEELQMQQNLSDGFIIRHATAADKKAIESTVDKVFGKKVTPIVEKLFTYHPDLPVSDHFLIMDTTKSQVAAYFCLSRSTCVLNGTEFPVGHMEVVATLPEYRHRGFIRRLNDLFEQRVEEYQLPLLAIIGIPYFYRNFGYEYALPFNGTVTVPTELIPKLKKGEEEPVLVEAITEKTFNQYLKARDHHNSYLDFYRKLSPAEYAYLTHGKLGDDSTFRFFVLKQGNSVVGSFMLSIFGGVLEVQEVWVDNLAHVPSMLRYLKGVAKRHRLPFCIDLPSRPALKPVLEGWSRSKFSRPYAWMVRIPSVKRFLDTITPVLDQRLAQSDFHKISDSVRISWYRAAIEIIINGGKVQEIKDIPRNEIKEIDAAVPFPAIYQLFMGYRTMEALREIYPDANVRAVRLPLVQVLFPKIRAQLSPDL